MAKEKFYAVWRGREPGVYDNWDDCRDQVEGFAGAGYKGYPSSREAAEALRAHMQDDEGGLILALAREGQKLKAGNADPGLPLEVNPRAIAVDGASAGNPGAMEYRGVEVGTGREIFHVGPLPQGTNNVAEYLAIVHALALLYNKGDAETPIYSDSLTGRAWVRRRGHRSQLKPTAANAPIMEMLRRADLWLQTHPLRNPLLRWDTASWGEIPADFGRK